MTTPTNLPFEHTPLITPQRLQADPHEAFSMRPAWVQDFQIIAPLPPDIEPIYRVTLSGKWQATFVFSGRQLATLFEITRLPRVSARVDNDGAGRLYLRLYFGDRKQDHTMVGRLLLDAGEYDRVRFIGTNREDMRPMNFKVSRRDYRPENIEIDVARRIGKWARQDTVRNVARIANAWEASGDMPAHFTAASYIANLEALLDAMDREAAEVEAIRGEAA